MTRTLFIFAAILAMSFHSSFVTADPPRTSNNNAKNKPTQKTTKSPAKTPTSSAKRPATKQPTSKPTAAPEVTPKTTRSTASRSRTLSKMTPARQAAAEKFAQTHHPELHSLLKNLKKTNKREFEKAVRELFSTSERLAKIEERDPERHKFQLETWKLDSRIRLLAARMTMTDDPALEAELKAALLARNQIRLQSLTLERDRSQKRVDQLNKTIERFQQDPTSSIEKEFERLKKSLGSYASKSKQRKPKTTSASRTNKNKPQTTTTDVDK